jgi:hypothetical protein
MCILAQLGDVVVSEVLDDTLEVSEVFEVFAFTAQSIQHHDDGQRIFETRQLDHDPPDPRRFDVSSQSHRHILVIAPLPWLHRSKGASDVLTSVFALVVNHQLVVSILIYRPESPLLFVDNRIDPPDRRQHRRE